MRYCYRIIGIVFLFNFTWLKAQLDKTYRNIAITGIRITKKEVILRELDLGRDSVFIFNDSVKTLWIQRISDLGLFTHVEIKRDPGEILIEVKERKYTWFLPEITWADRNFHIWWKEKDPSRLIYGGTLFLNNLRGRNQSLAIQAIHGYNRSYSAQFSRPFPSYNKGFAYAVGAGYWSNHELWYKTRNDKLEFLRLESVPVQRNTWVSAMLRKRLSYYSFAEFSADYGTYRYADSAVLKDEMAVKRYMAGQIGDYAAIGIAFTTDHRKQRHYPVGGYFFTSGVQYTNIRINPFFRSPVILQGYLKGSYFKPLGRWVLTNSLQASHNTDLNALVQGTLPYVFSRQLGYESRYVRGYESYVADGMGFVLGKMGLRRPLYQHSGKKIPGIAALKNYRTLPVSVWCTIFADAGRVIKPVMLPENTLNTRWLSGAGAGLDVIFWYTAMSRLELSRNHRGEWVFNMSFVNAF
jgi:outer membrane protein assembly factor BamA